MVAGGAGGSWADRGRIVGVDQDARAIGSVADALFLAENLPANATVEISVSAVNNGGESPLS